MGFVLTPEYIVDLETNIRTISSQLYDRLASQRWSDRVAKYTTSQTKAERVDWLLDTARIERRLSGTVSFEDPVILTREFENEFAAAGLLLKKEQLEDVVNGVPGGQGLAVAANWARQIGQLAAYWPQKMIAKAIREGGDAGNTTYDGEIFFSAAHPVNGQNADDGTFANDLTAAALGSGGAAPIFKADGSITVEEAFENLQRVFAYMAGVKMPNGEDPRGLRPVGILVPPSMTARAQQVTNAKLIAQAATSGGGGADVEAIIRNWGIGQPLQADELGANFDGDDETYYVIAAGMDRDELGALLYVDREPFNIIMHNEITSAELARKRELQWLAQGRNTVAYGHPYFLFRVPPT